MAWTIILFVLVILEWWMDFQYRLGDDLVNPFYFILYLLRPLQIFFILRVMFDKNTEDYNIYFYDNLNKLLILLFVYCFYELFFTYIKTGAYLSKFVKSVITHPMQLFWLINLFFIGLLLIIPRRKLLLKIYTLLAIVYLGVILSLASNLWLVDAKTIIGN